MQGVVLRVMCENKQDVVTKPSAIQSVDVSSQLQEFGS